jgi:hypothetical protein
MTFNEAEILIANSNLNKSQKLTARILLGKVRRNAKSTLDGDVVEYDLRLTGEKGDRFVSFVCFASSKLYDATLTVVIGPRGGRDVGTAELRYSFGGKGKFYL